MKATFYSHLHVAVWMQGPSFSWSEGCTLAAIAQVLASWLSWFDGMGFICQSFFISLHLGLAWDTVNIPINASWICCTVLIVHDISSLLKIWSIKLTQQIYSIKCENWVNQTYSVNKYLLCKTQSTRAYENIKMDEAQLLERKCGRLPYAKS